MIKLIANLLIIAGVCVGAVTATTAYRWSLSLPDDAFVLDKVAVAEDEPAGYVQLKASAGRTIDLPAGEEPNADPAASDSAAQPGDASTPIARASTLTAPSPLDPDTLAKLRSAGVESVLVKTFRFNNWEHRWLFVGCVAAIMVGGLTIRIVGRPQVVTDGSGVGIVSPADTLRDAADAIDSLTEGLRGMSTDAERCKAIMHELGEVLQTHMVAFVETRELLIAKLGLGRFAQIMDRFAGSERRLNRAWSAAADGHEPEATESLSEGRELLMDTIALLDSMS